MTAFSDLTDVPAYAGNAGHRLIVDKDEAELLYVDTFLHPFPAPSSDGILLLSAFGQMGKATWKGSRHGQSATISGAFVPRPGPWPGSHAIIPVPGGSPLNMIKNPSFETNDTDWSGGSLHGNSGRANDRPRYGCYSYEAITTGGGAYLWYCEGAGYTAVTQGQYYTVSAWVYAPVGGDTVSVGWAEYEDDSTYLGMSGTNYVLRPGWQRLVHSAQATADPNGCDKVRPSFYNLDTGMTYYVDAFCLEPTDGVTPYCDGTQSGGSWTSTAHASTSNRTATEIQYDDFAELLSGEDSVSIRLVIQAPLDSDDARWPVNGATNSILDIRGASDSHRIYISYSSSGDIFRVYINGDWRIASSAQSFKAGDWIELLLTLDFANNDYKLYVNGDEDGTDTTSLSAPTLGSGSSTFNLGSTYTAASHGCFAFAEVAIWTKEIADQNDIAEMYGRPLMDVAGDGPMPFMLTTQEDTGESTYTLAVMPDKYYWGWRSKDHDHGDGASFMCITGKDSQEGLEIVEWYNEGPKGICAFLYGGGDIEWNFAPGAYSNSVTISSGVDLTIKTTDGDDIVIQSTGINADTKIEASRRMEVQGDKVCILANETGDWTDLSAGDIEIRVFNTLYLLAGITPPAGYSAGDIVIGGDGDVCFVSPVVLENVSSDPSGAEGAMVYRSDTDKVRVYSNGAWRYLAWE